MRYAFSKLIISSRGIIVVFVKHSFSQKLCVPKIIQALCHLSFADEECEALCMLT